MNIFKNVCCYLFIIFISTQTFAESEQCEGKYKEQVLTRDNVVELIQQREKEHGLESKVEINLCGAKLQQVDLSQLNLNYTNFDEANLNYANLAGSDLSYSSFKKANLQNANLDKGYLIWSNLTEADLRHANLEMSDLSDANLSKTHLDFANFSIAVMRRTNFYNAKANITDFSISNLSNSNFSNAVLVSAKFEKAKAKNVDFTGADLQEVNFIQTDLSNANLTSSNLKQAQLKRAKLINTNLENASFKEANLSKTVYQVQLGKLPNIVDLATVDSFDEILFFDPKLGAPAIIELRAAYKKAGMRRMERTITAMLKENEMLLNGQRGGFDSVKGLVSYILFKLTCEFGLEPIRPLKIVILLILICTVPYRAAISYGTKMFSIIKKKADGTETLLKASSSDSFIHYCYQFIYFWGISLYFSILSAFQIGWESFNVATWLSKLQTEEYKLIPKGWLRTLSGVQGLVSAYLVALSLFAYFGRPFEW